MESYEDYSMFNSMMGVTSEEVEKVTLNDISLIQGRRIRFKASRHNNNHILNYQNISQQSTDSSITERECNPFTKIEPQNLQEETRFFPNFANPENPLPEGQFKKQRVSIGTDINLKIHSNQSRRSNALSNFNPKIAAGDTNASKSGSDDSDLGYEILKFQKTQSAASVVSEVEWHTSTAESATAVLIHNQPQDVGHTTQHDGHRDGRGSSGHKGQNSDRNSNNGNGRESRDSNGGNYGGPPGGMGGGGGGGGNGGGRDNQDGSDQEDGYSAYSMDLTEHEDETTSTGSESVKSRKASSTSRTSRLKKTLLMPSTSKTTKNSKPKIIPFTNSNALLIPTNESSGLEAKNSRKKSSKIYFKDKHGYLHTNYDALPQWMQRFAGLSGDTKTKISNSIHTEQQSKTSKNTNPDNISTKKGSGVSSNFSPRTSHVDDKDLDGLSSLSSVTTSVPLSSMSNAERGSVETQSSQSEVKIYITEPQDKITIKESSTVSPINSSSVSKLTIVRQRRKKTPRKSHSKKLHKEGKRMVKGRVKRPEAASEYFSDGEISSDSDLDKSDSSSAEDERDAEWLKGEDGDYGQTSNVDDSEIMLGTEEITKGLPSKVASEKLMSCMMPLFNMMRFTGRLPITIQKRDKRPEKLFFDRNSWAYRVFVASSTILTLSLISMMFNIIKIFQTTGTKTFYQNILMSEFNKYFLEAMTTIFSLYVVCTWSISTIFEGGLHLGEYLTRWNLSTYALKYDVTRGITFLIRLYQIGFAIYSLLFIILFFFGGDAIPSARESSGFIALLVAHTFFTELRVNPYYFIFQYLGLIFHLYLVLCTALILLPIVAYCIALKNAACKFNLRLALALRKVALPINGKLTMNVSKIIPYDKLWGEHVVVTALSRHTGQVFSVALNAFFFTTMFGMVITLYVLTEPIFHGLPSFNETHFQISNSHASKYGSVSPVRTAEPRVVIVLKALYFFLNCWITFFAFSEIIHQAGAAIMSGFGYVRRHGQILCQSLNEHRFIMSMENSAAPNRDFFIKTGYSINRQFVLNVLGFVFVLYLFLVQLNPQRLEIITKETICDHADDCLKIRASRYHKHDPGISVLQPTTKAPGPNLITTILPPSKTGSPKPGRAHIVPCDPDGLLPINLPTFSYPCKGSSMTTYIPLVFKKSGQYFDRVPSNCETNEVDLSGTVYNCFGEEIIISNVIEDDCKMPKIPTPNKKGTKSDPGVDLAPLPSNSNPQGLYCCFKYIQLEQQSAKCNFVNTSQYLTQCTKSKSTIRVLYEELLQREISFQNIQNPRGNSKLNWTLWSDCICQDLSQIPRDISYCRPLLNEYPPCHSSFTRFPHHSDEGFNPTTCSWDAFKNLEKGLKMQLLYKRDEYFRYYPVIGANSTCQSHAYPNTTSLDPIRNNTQFSIVDCYGNEVTSTNVEDIETDDCQNFRLKMNGNAEPGTNEVNLVYRKAHETPGLTNDSIFCCFTWPNSPSQSVCNLNPNTASQRCGKKPKSHIRQQVEAMFWEKYKENVGPLPEHILTPYKNCICQGVGGLPKDSCRDYKCSTNASVFEETMTKTCDDGRVLGYLLVENTTTAFHHQDCNKSKHNLDDFRKPESGLVRDCYGNFMKYDEYRDDCGNFRIATTNKNNTETLPTLTMRNFGNSSRFLCCWKYAGYEKEFERCNLRETNWMDKKLLCRFRIISANSDFTAYNGGCNAKTNWTGTQIEEHAVFNADNKNIYYNRDCLAGTRPTCIQDPKAFPSV